MLAALTYLYVTARSWFDRLTSHDEEGTNG